MFGEYEIKVKEVDQYLGNLFHTEGLSPSADVTVEEKMSKIRAPMFKVKEIIDDF